jgi:hypothetical protein
VLAYSSSTEQEVAQWHSCMQASKHAEHQIRQPRDTPVVLRGLMMQARAWAQPLPAQQLLLLVTNSLLEVLIKHGCTLTCLEM